MTTPTKAAVLVALKSCVVAHTGTFDAFLPVIKDGVAVAAIDHDASVLNEMYAELKEHPTVASNFVDVIKEGMPGTRFTLATGEFTLAEVVEVKPIRYKNFHRRTTKKREAAAAKRKVEAEAEAKRTKKEDDINADMQAAMKRVIEKYSAKGTKLTKGARAALEEYASVYTEWYEDDAS